METEIEFEFLDQPIVITEHKWKEDINALVYVQVLTYNHEPYIRDCIEGILMQKTTFPVHIVVFEDCSTDKTAFILKEYKEKHPGLFTLYLQPENTYGKEIRKEALKPWFETSQKGKYITKCEGDDYWTDPLKLQKQADFMEKNPEYSLCYHSHFERIDDKIFKKKIPTKGRDFTQDELIATPSGIATASKFFINYNKLYGISLQPGFGRDFCLNAFLGSLGKCKFLASIEPSIRRLHTGGVWSSKSKTEKSYSTINVKIQVYDYYRQQNNKHRMNVSLEALKNAIDFHLPKVYPEYKRHNYPYRHFKLMYKDTGIVIFYAPVIELLKRILRKFKRIYKTIFFI